MRRRTFQDARRKLAQSPDAKVPGWPAIEQMFGAEAQVCLRAVVNPGSDVTPLAIFKERYLYNEADGNYIDRQRFGANEAVYYHSPRDLRDRHAPDKIMIKGKGLEAFRIFEHSRLRDSVGSFDMFPQGAPGIILRLTAYGALVPDDYDEKSRTVFNMWRGWDYQPTASPDSALLTECREKLNKLLGFLTCGNEAQMDWVWKWIAYTLQFPANKQQVAWVVAGGQGVGKSFMGNIFLDRLFGSLFGHAASKSFGERFTASLVLGRIMVFVDEARLRGTGAIDEVKELVRSSKINGEMKGIESRDYNNFARFYFASNTLNTGMRYDDTVDRAMYITKAITPEHLNMSHIQFQRTWVDKQKPFFEEFAAFLQRREVLEHYMSIMMNMKVDKREIENVSHSSVTDPDIIRNNLSPARRIAVQIIESGTLLTDLDIVMPFSQVDFNRAVTTLCKETGYNVRAEWVWEEYKNLGMIEPFHGKWRFKWNLGELTHRFGEAIGTTLTPQFEFTDADYGLNAQDGAKPVLWRGVKRGRL
jgi:hypothetical protein